MARIYVSLLNLGVLSGIKQLAGTGQVYVRLLYNPDLSSSASETESYMPSVFLQKSHDDVAKEGSTFPRFKGLGQCHSLSSQPPSLDPRAFQSPSLGLSTPSLGPCTSRSPSLGPCTLRSLGPEASQSLSFGPGASQLPSSNPRASQLPSPGPGAPQPHSCGLGAPQPSSQGFETPQPTSSSLEASQPPSPSPSISMDVFPNTSFF